MTRSEKILRHTLLNEFLCLLDEEYNYSPDQDTADKLTELCFTLAEKIADPKPEDEELEEELCGDMDQFESMD
jgi:hypothetical protein